MAVGGGVGGIQSALDLAEAGFKVYLVEKQPAIGGRMAQLDKTFPTNDCSMCTLSPRLVECGRHPNITVLTCAEIKGLRGEPGNFEVRLRLRARYVKLDKCIGCGDCATVCPIEVKDQFNAGMSLRKAIYRPYAQAFPGAYVIDMDKCPECVKCQEACPSDAINPFMWDEEKIIRVGALILSTGYELIEAGTREEWGYGLYPNVITGIQFERLLSASGPHGGSILRPSDGKEPRKIAFIQCAGSRDLAHGQEYCSSVCCMYATKQAMLAKEHLPDLDVALFCMDIRVFGKDYERYYQRARDRYGVRYVRCMISAVQELQRSKNLRIRYRLPDGGFREEDFDLVVLSVGMRPSPDVYDLTKVTGIQLNNYGFCDTWELYPTLTSRPGIFTAGALNGPRDIPEVVVEAGAAAGEIARLLHPARGSLASVKTYPPERDVDRQEPRIGVFVCHCGTNIGSVVDVPGLVRYARELHGVVYTEEFMFACSQDSINRIVECIREYNLNRVVVASCTPRTHAPLFQSGLREAGLNPYLYEQVNIREHVAWVHQHVPEEATVKAKDLVRMAVAKVRLLKPVTTVSLQIVPQALVVGGGAAGMTAALTVADQGFRVFLVEQEPYLGGNLRHLFHTLDGSDAQAFLRLMVDRVSYHPLIEVLTGSSILAVEGYAGNYRTRIRVGDEERELHHGVVILASGAEESHPREYLYGAHSAVMTQTELEQKLDLGKLHGIDTVVMIQCVGSRNDERPYCSRLCCSHAVKNALRIKRLNPRVNIFILYRDMMTYGLREQYYRRAREQGVVFIRYRPDKKPAVRAEGNKVAVTVIDPVLNEELTIRADILGLSAAIVPRRDNQKLSRLFKTPLNPDGFFAEAHMKLRPVDSASDGVYLCGLAHAPKMLSESLAQAGAAGMRAATMLSKQRLESVGTSSVVDPALCSGCGLCAAVCPYEAITIDPERGTAQVQEVVCRGCGTCAATCPSGACRQNGFEDEQLLAMVEEALSNQ
ncbi:MAG: CoB--CoM heterodisulfide reductase iron-sulfur subunit A family protein [Peptococcaceae bacterium]|nr:CoB--CoM heterodisulfide reductase iron-sulfur subunit A family protein [Peptococcaceae bacterium]